MMYNGYIVIKCFAIVWAPHGILGQTALTLTRGGEETNNFDFQTFPLSSSKQKQVGEKADKLEEGAIISRQLRVVIQ